ncbi:MAG: hypothetical protein HKO65_03080 [Gemmatimonadetes bacterium]|nr:PD-(D/E)XK nuclease family protein [Gemmatimonadota bacterium]NNM04062.1 hypothetical protein [Gemmatimonadota bacterium]
MPVQPIFLGWDGPALPRAATLMAEEYATADGLDLRGVVVVTPAARAGRRLMELLLEEAEARRVPFTPPRTVTIGRFPELLYQPTGPIADATTSRHAFSQALKKTDPQLLQEVFPDLAPNLSGWMALAGIVEKLHREVGAEGRDFLDVAREFRHGLPYDDSNRWEALAEVQKTYLEILVRSGHRDRDRERKAALNVERLTPPGDVWMVGVVELPGVVRKMVHALPVPIRALVHAPEELRHRFDSLGCVIPAEWEGIHIKLEDPWIRVVQRPRDQAAATVEALWGFSGRYAAEEVVVGVPDADLVPFLEQGLSGVEVPHRFAGGTPVEETGPVRLLQTVAEYLGGKPYPAFAALIRHPDLHDMVEAAVRVTVPAGEGHGPGSADPTSALTFVDRFQTRHLQDSVGGPLPGEDKDARRTRDLVKYLDQALGLGALEGTRPISEWMPVFLEILVRGYGGQPIDRSKSAVRQMLDAMAHIKGAASRLATLPPNLDMKVEAPEAMGVLLAELTGPELTLPPDPEEHAVELLGWLELPLDDAPAVVVTGVNERILPESMGADAFLPGTLRTRLGIPDDKARYARDAYLLSAMVESREEVHLVAGRLTGDGDPLRPSRLLFADEPEVVAQRIMRYLGEEVSADAEPGSTEGMDIEAAGSDMDLPRGAHRDAQESQFVSPPEDPLPPLEGLDRISVTAFAAYLKDPYRYALTRILKLEPLDDDAREMDGAVFGSLAHEVLERFGRTEEAGSDDADVVEKKLYQLLGHLVKDQFGSSPVPAVRVQVEQLRARLRRFARWQSDWVREGWRIVAVEAKPEDGVPLVVDGEPVNLRGKIDRIDHNSTTDEWAIFDYKTGDKGEAPEDTHRKGPKSSKEWVDLQLPLYRRLLSGVRKEDGTPVVPESAWDHVRLGYILLPRELDKVGSAEGNWSEDELAQAYATAEEVIRKLRSEPFHYNRDTKSFRDDALNPLLGRLELPRADDGDDGDGVEDG